MSHYISHLTKHPKLLASAVIIGTPIAYLFYTHRSLSKKVHHASRKGLLTATTAQTIASIPSSVLSSDLPMYHDTSTKAVPKSLLPAMGQRELLTTYLRHNMCLFSTGTLQAWALYFMSTPKERGSFAPEYLQKLNFEKGDLVIGVHRVLIRTDGNVEFDLKPFGAIQGGRLSISVQESGDEYVFMNETVMWKNAGEKGIMPLESAFGKFLHESLSWWLLNVGTNFLVGLGGRKSL
ncbi:hypothetical protein G7Y89_g2907 [Cudoniella acicularis]|uniref:Uncharacterized protein n=1 Tax=Cudoniella acicularis TaxID=354080 RepID=A0A8H4RT90_9HELO|nr:hypothetical protein G7Y89_g2907 [Cudoniella acicularis]